MNVDAKFEDLSWIYLQVSLKTEIIFKFPTEAIAYACIYLSAKISEVPVDIISDEGLGAVGQNRENIEQICCHIIRYFNSVTSKLNFEELKRNVARIPKKSESEKNDKAEGNKPTNPDANEDKLEVKNNGIDLKTKRDTKKRKRTSLNADDKDNPPKKKNSKISSSGGSLSSHTPRPRKRHPEILRRHQNQDQGIRVQVVRNDDIQMLKLVQSEEES